MAPAKCFLALAIADIRCYTITCQITDPFSAGCTVVTRSRAPADAASCLAIERCGREVKQKAVADDHDHLPETPEDGGRTVEPPAFIVA